MEVIFKHTFTPTIDLKDVEIEWAVRRLKKKKPDVLLSCTRYEVGSKLIETAKEKAFFPKAISLTASIGTDQFDKRLGDDVKYIMSPVQWARELPVIGTDVFDGSAENFHQLYEKHAGYAPNYQAAGAAAALVLYKHAIESANSVEHEDVIAVLKRSRLDTFFGVINIDAVTGANSGKPMIALQYTTEVKLEVVAPAVFATDFATYPAPTWSERSYSDGWYTYGSEIAMTSIASVLIVISIALIVFVIAFRRRMAIRAASPIFLILILFSSILVYSSVFVWQLYATDGSCATIPWLLGMGATLFFGCIVVRTWRISQIFTSNEFKVTSIQDYHLGLFLAVLMIIEVTILAIWTGVDRLEAVLVIDDDDRPSEGYTECQEGDISIWAWVGPLVGFNLALGLIGVYFCFRVRNVEQIVFNESKELLFAIYNVLLAGTLVITLQAGNSSARETLFILTSCAIMGGMFVSVMAIMLPKLYGVSQAHTFTTGSRFDHSTQTTDHSSSTSFPAAPRDRSMSGAEAKSKIFL
eukprot:TRINITY_DN5422_c0_g1_i1.p1 TRINITY_DN5422_c0_g1~~TRINITY_DN5422_c0_g1_i1.p1  ORF type:complete len:525 (-),score=73.33 TRINITY_DN5422_c0_g1_i1:126-1700(-)